MLSHAIAGGGGGRIVSLSPPDTYLGGRYLICLKKLTQRESFLTCDVFCFTFTGLLYGNGALSSAAAAGHVMDHQYVSQGNVSRGWLGSRSATALPARTARSMTTTAATSACVICGQILGRGCQELVCDTTRVNTGAARKPGLAEGTEMLSAASGAAAQAGGESAFTTKLVSLPSPPAGDHDVQQRSRAAGRSCLPLFV